MKTKLKNVCPQSISFWPFTTFALYLSVGFSKDPKEFTVPAFASDVASKNTNRHMMKDIILQIVKMSLNF